MATTPATTTDDALAALAAGRNRDPFAVLGPHPEPGGGLVIRAYQPAARSMDIRLPDGELRAMDRRNPPGLYETVVPADVSHYRLRVELPGGHVVEFDDPYRYGRVLTDFDLHLLGEGTHYRAFDKLGAHRIAVGSTDRHPLRRVGAQRRSRQRDRRLQRLGRPRPRHASADAERRLGDFHSRPARRRGIQVRDPHGHGATCTRRAIPTASRSRRPRTRPHSFTTPRTIPGATTSGWRRGEATTPGSMSRCRSTRCTSDRGRASRKRATGSCRIASWRAGSCRTSRRWDSRTSSCCR